MILSELSKVFCSPLLLILAKVKFVLFVAFLLSFNVVWVRNQLWIFITIIIVVLVLRPNFVSLYMMLLVPLELALRIKLFTWTSMLVQESRLNQVDFPWIASILTTNDFVHP